MGTTTNLALRYPALSDAPNVPQNVQNLASDVDTMLGGVVLCTSTTRPTARDGAMIYESDTKRYMTYSSAAGAWVCQGSNESLFVRKPSNQSVTSSTTLVNDTALALSVQANATYWLEWILAYTAAAAGDLKVQLNVPSGAVFQGFGQVLISTAASQGDDQIAPTNDSVALTWGALGSATQYGRVTGTLVTAGSAGTAQLQWAQLASSGTATSVLSGSWIMGERVA